MFWWWAWLIVFIVAIYTMGIIHSRKIKTAEEYVMADFSLGFFPVCGSIIATSAGAAAIIGSSGKGYQIGIAWGVCLSPANIYSIILVLILGATIRKMRLHTLPELFMRRFGKSTGLFPSLITGFLYMVPTFAMQLVGLAAVFEAIFSVPMTYGLLLSFVICTGFTLLGGLPSVAWTDAVQSVIILIGLIVLAVVATTKLGGFSGVEKAAPGLLLDSFTTKLDTQTLLKWTTIFGPFYLIWQTTWQRIAAAKTTKIAVSGVTVGNIILILISFLAAYIGVLGKGILPGELPPDKVYGALMKEVIHPGLGGLFMVALMAALLTGATSFLLSGATNVSQDIIKNFLKPDISQEGLLKYSRISVAVMAFLGLLISFGVQDIINIYTYALSFSAVTMVAPMLAAMFWKRATKAGAMAGVFGGFLTALVWRVVLDNPNGVHEILPGLGVSFAMVIIVSLLTGHSKDEDVTAYFSFYKDKPTV